jgi:hypothetical protein
MTERAWRGCHPHSLKANSVAKVVDGPKVYASDVAHAQQWSASRVVMIGTWVLDLLWLPLMYVGNPTLRTVGFVGFGTSLIVWWIALSIYNRGKARGRSGVKPTG